MTMGSVSNSLLKLIVGGTASLMMAAGSARDARRSTAELGKRAFDMKVDYAVRQIRRFLAGGYQWYRDGNSDASGDSNSADWRPRNSEQDTAVPGSGQVRLRQAAAGLNYIDVYHRTGYCGRPARWQAL